MKFETAATTNPIDQLKVVGRPTNRTDGPLKTTGRAPYAYEHQVAAPNQAYGYVVGSAIAKGRITKLDVSRAEEAPGVIAVVTASNAGPLKKANRNTATLFGGPKIEHYHQAIAVVVAETFEQARAAAGLLQIEYAREQGKFDLEASRASATDPKKITAGASDTSVGDFEGAFAKAAVKLDATYTTPDQSHVMMEPPATIATWEDGNLTVRTSHQMVDWARSDLATTLGLEKEQVRVITPYVGGGFGAKLFLRADVIAAALGARAAKRPVKVALQRPLSVNNLVHRPATIQRIRIGAERSGKITAIGHESWSGDLPNGKPDGAVHQTRLLYAGADRMTRTRLAILDLPEANAMRAPGEATGLMALEIAMDEMAEKLGLDPVEFRIINDTQVVPDVPAEPSSDDPQARSDSGGTDEHSAKELRFSQRHLVECLRTGAEKFGWSKRNKIPGQMREGDWLIGHGVAGAIRGNKQMKSAARVRLDRGGVVTVETDMTDIGTGSYTIIAQTAAEMMGIPIDKVVVRLGDSAFPVSAGSGGQWGGNCSTSGVYAACVKLREAVAQKLGFNVTDAAFEDGQVRASGRALPLAQAARDGELVAEDVIEFGGVTEESEQATFAAHFVEVAVDAFTGETRIRRMLSVCDCGRILNPKSARSQVIGGMSMGVGAALTEELAVDKRFGFFVNHDLASYEVPVHADIPHQEVIFFGDADPMSSPMKAKGVAELGISGVAAAVANAVYNAVGVRVREYPLTMDKLLAGLPQIA
ncbi:molybdopterin cofactor-binding domain-containing protein [Novosphingobium sp. M1R2S20]|uniref:Molybdopterin cofactor-binding domain-containing protein n=1 Tax=Novosphingobium rhizovicinum TaxID=3228928 RepID=A0ABV3RAY7_9SPHN